MFERKEGGAEPFYVFYERRKHDRRPLSVSISFQVISGREPERRSSFVHGTLQDISLGGLRFHTSAIVVDDLHIQCDYDEEPFKENRLLLEVPLPDPYGKVVAVGKAVWFQRRPGTGPVEYAVGVEFLEFMDECRASLQRFMESPE